MSNFSFKKGYDQVQRKDLGDVRLKLMSALHISTRAAFLGRLHGKVEPLVSEARAIEGVFAEYRITEIWGE